MRTSALCIVLGLLSAGCAAASGADGNLNATARPLLQSEVITVAAGPPTTIFERAESSRPEDILATMTTEEKIGQLFMPVFDGGSAGAPTPAARRENLGLFGFETPAEAIDYYHLGGVIYLGNNIESADQVGAFSDGLQDAAIDDTGVGLLIAVDQEGGSVNRLTDGVTVFPSAAVLSGDQESVREAGYVTGSQVSHQGINVVLAPVADVTSPGWTSWIGNRSYGDDPVVVSDMVSASVDGLQRSGVAAAVKHWPGHGATEVDSHEALPSLEIGRTEWEGRERLPFAAAIEQDVAIVMVGHLAFPALDPAAGPATTSPVLIDELLRVELGFDGVVMTDALNMGAVNGTDSGLILGALNAGADILLMPPDLPTAYQVVVDAVESGDLSGERLDQSVLRILQLKDELGLLPEADERP